jgi:predicted nucleotidyltransferase
MNTLAIDLPEAAITKFCEQNHIRKLSLFGSVLRDDFTESSDIDILVEFQPAPPPGLAIVTMQDELAELWERNVDLRTSAELSRYFRDQVMQEAMVIYVEG